MFNNPSMGQMGMGILAQALKAQQPAAPGGAANPMAQGLIPMLMKGGNPNGLLAKLTAAASAPAAAPATPGAPMNILPGGPGAGANAPVGLLSRLLGSPAGPALNLNAPGADSPPSAAPMNLLPWS